MGLWASLGAQRPPEALSAEGAADLSSGAQRVFAQDADSPCPFWSPAQRTAGRLPIMLRVAAAAASTDDTRVCGKRALGERLIRILVLSNLYPPHHIGGYELRCRAVVDGLRRRGQRVHVLTGRYQTTAPEEKHDHVTRTLHLTWGPPYAPEDLPGMLRCEAADRRTLMATLNALRPDAVDVWGMEFASQSLVADLLATGVAVHFTLDDVWLADGYQRDPLCAVTAVARQLGVQMSPGINELCCLGLERPALDRAAVHFVSQALLERYNQTGFRHLAGEVRIAGIDLSPFRHQKPTSPPPPFVIVSVGQLTASRGQADLITSAGRVANDASCPFPLVVRIIGGGSASYVAELERLAGRYASDQFRVELTGPQSPNRVADFYAGAHLFVHTSRLPEGLPRVLIEALAAGVPVISTNTGGQRDILADGRFGRLVPPDDPHALERAIRDALAHPPSWQARANAARQHALQHYDTETYVEEHRRDLAHAADRAVRGVTRAARSAALWSDEITGFTESLGQAVAAQAESLDAAADPDGAWRLGVVLKRTGKLDAAARLLTRLHETHRGKPTHVRRATFHLAELAIVRGDWPSAADLLQTCVAVAPDHTKAAFDLRHVEQRRVPAHLSALARQPAALA